MGESGKHDPNSWHHVTWMLSDARHCMSGIGCSSMIMTTPVHKTWSFGPSGMYGAPRLPSSPGESFMSQRWLINQLSGYNICRASRQDREANITALRHSLPREPWNVIGVLADYEVESQCHAWSPDLGLESMTPQDECPFKRKGPVPKFTCATLADNSEI